MLQIAKPKLIIKQLYPLIRFIKGNEKEFSGMQVGKCSFYPNLSVQNKSQTKKKDATSFGSFPFATEKIAAFSTDRLFFNTLVEYIRKSKYIPTRDELVVLNIGCGRGDGTQALASYFGKKNFGEISNNVNVYGIDPRTKHIEDARNRYKNLGQQVKFIDGYLGDAIEEEPKIKNNADIVLIKHPNIDNGTQRA